MVRISGIYAALDERKAKIRATNSTDLLQVIL
jgi:hypothetical protein